MGCKQSGQWRKELSRISRKKGSLGYVFKDKKLVSWIKMGRIVQAKCIVGAKVYRGMRKPIAFGDFPLVLCD